VPGAVVAAIADVNLAAAQDLADKLHIPRVYADYREIMQDPSIDAVAICSSTNTHADLIIEAAAAGKHIFCEKPVDHSLVKIDKAIEAVKKAGVKCQIGFNRRFDSNFKKLRDLVKEGKIGDLHILRITSRDPAPPPAEYIKSSGGMFLDMTIHDFDMARYLAPLVTEVYATGSVLIDSELEEFGDLDTALLTLKFKDGTIGSIDNSRQAVYGYDQRLEVFCLEGTDMAENEKENTVLKGNREGFLSSRVPNFFMQRYAPCYVDEVRQFLESVRDDLPTVVTGEDGRNAVVIGYAAWKSFHENRPVKISEITG
jgi:myo-inositol 2-dehydrogenase/D-chiro-inositol 1-dehydrogenase